MWKSPPAYFKDLDEADKPAYVKKLTLNNGTLLPDPISVKKEWSDDIGLLPDLTWPDLVNYLINTPSEYTRDKIRAYKSLEAYNLFLQGHVQDVFIYLLTNEKLESVFTKVILPELVTRKLDPNNEQKHKLYCYCNKPYFNPMIACDGKTCTIEWFHYSCVNLTRTPKENKNWLCPDCTPVKKNKKSTTNKC